MRLLKLLLVLFVCAAGPAVAGPFEDGVEAYDKGNYEKAMRLIRPFAEVSNANAQVYLGTMYANGEGVPQDYAEALAWLRKAAEQGYARGQLNLGFMYLKGWGVPQDYATAAAWYLKAAEQGNVRAQNQVGYMYANGQGVPEDYVQAYKWWTLAVAGQRVTNAITNAERIGYKMTDAQITEAQKLAGEWKPKSAPQDYAAALSRYREAAEQGDASAQFNLGVMYDKGQGVPQDYAAAASWYRKAAEQGSPGGQFNLGIMYASGRGVTQDYVQAHMWWNLAATKGYADAIKSRGIVAAKMTPAQIAEAQKLAQEWKPESKLAQERKPESERRPWWKFW